MKVCIVGCGNIGTATAVEMVQRFTGSDLHIVGIDPSGEARRRFIQATTKANQSRHLRLLVEAQPDTVPGDANLYSLSVFDQPIIVEMASKISEACRSFAIVSVESTMSAATGADVFRIARDSDCYWVAFPHRWNPGDAEHGVFNQPRLLGGAANLDRNEADKFLRQHFGYDQSTPVAWRIAILGKLTENAHRFCEIALAQELRLSCEATGVDFEELRAAVNSKWNIHIYEARDGIGGTCLPKDTKMFCQAFPGHFLARLAIERDKSYRQKHGK